MTTTLLKRLPPEVRLAIIERLSNWSRNDPVSISEMVHVLSAHHRSLELSEITLKSSIAEAAIERGLSVAFDGT